MALTALFQVTRDTATPYIEDRGDDEFVTVSLGEGTADELTLVGTLADLAQLARNLHDALLFLQAHTRQAAPPPAAPSAQDGEPVLLVVGQAEPGRCRRCS